MLNFKRIFKKKLKYGKERETTVHNKKIISSNKEYWPINGFKDRFKEIFFLNL